MWYGTCELVPPRWGGEVEDHLLDLKRSELWQGMVEVHLGSRTLLYSISQIVQVVVGRTLLCFVFCYIILVLLLCQVQHSGNAAPAICSQLPKEGWSIRSDPPIRYPQIHTHVVVLRLQGLSHFFVSHFSCPYQSVTGITHNYLGFSVLMCANTCTCLHLHLLCGVDKAAKNGPFCIGSNTQRARMSILCL